MSVVAIQPEQSSALATPSSSQAEWHTLLIEPLAPLVFRSGRPFGSGPSDGAQFPLPSSVSGALRARHADSQGLPFTESLRELTVHGPLLARLTTGGVPLPLAPAPADALFARESDGSQRLMRLAPVSDLGKGVGCDLDKNLLPISLQGTFKGKPLPGLQWWALSDLVAWRSGADPELDALARNGLPALRAEHRTHVSIDAASGAALDGALFQTSGIDFGAAIASNGARDDALCLLAQSAAAPGLNDGQVALIGLGGEGRLSRLLPSPTTWPLPPVGWAERCLASGGIALSLVTPAIFSAGWLPAWARDSDSAGYGRWPGSDLRLRLRAASVQRWIPVSGWDMQHRRPRANRKAVAAGATYWFEFAPRTDKDAIQATWLAPASDDWQDRLDGFGLAIGGPWTPL